MTIWLLALVLMAAAVSAGYVQGAIRVAFALLGIVAGILLAMPLSPLFTPLLPFIGITNAWTLAILAPIVAFFAVEVAFKVAGAFVHRKVEYYFKYHMTDIQRTMWERMNRATGASLATIGGAIFFVLACLLISVVGYFTVQVGAAESQSSILRFFTRMAQDASVTRMDKVVGGMSPAPQSYYETSDFLGFLVHNRNVFRRITTYPPFAALSADHYLDGDPARSKYVPARDLIDGTDYLKTLATETDLSVILDQPRTQEIITNAELRQWLRAIDLNDLA
ncbi:MAG: CvpA family protein, partial [Verrucomicrobia bacterium]|nr:CvpA family protein [Verrucomicrobiota bacterium]